MEDQTVSITSDHETASQIISKEEFKYDEKNVNGYPNSDSAFFSNNSTNTSSNTFNSEASNEPENILPAEHDNFMKIHVKKLFDSSQEITTTDKQTFGEFCQTLDGRKAFAKHVDNHRCCSLQVDESTFYKLAHSFALVLFECNEADDFLPAKILMNMTFTYYHYPEGNNIHFKNNSSHPIELHSPDLKEFTRHLSGSEGDTDDDDIDLFKKKRTKEKISDTRRTEDKTSIWKSANDWFAKELILCKQFLKDAPGFSSQPPIKNKVITSVNSTDKENKSDQLEKNTNGNTDNANLTDLSATASTNVQRTEKVYLYQALQNQTIWQSLRFWNAAFFDAVNAERQVYCSKVNWKSLSEVERENVSETLKNLTFAHLGTFIVNMKHLGIGKETCLQFLRKQSVIGNLDRDLYQLLRKQIEMPLETSNEN